MEIIAHRCGTDRHPELTAASALHSLNKSVSYVEIDTRFTKDNVIVLSHDHTPKRIFGVDKLISDMTAEEFLALRFPDRPQYCSHTLEHMLQSGVDRILFHVKEGGERLYAIMDLCEKYHVLDKVCFGVQSPEDVKIVKSRGEYIRVLAFMPKAENAQAFIDAGADVIRLWEQWITDEAVNLVKSQGRKVWIMANPPIRYAYATVETVRNWEQMGIDGVLVDDIEELKRHF